MVFPMVARISKLYLHLMFTVLILLYSLATVWEVYWLQTSFIFVCKYLWLLALLALLDWLSLPIFVASYYVNWGGSLVLPDFYFSPQMFVVIRDAEPLSSSIMCCLALMCFLHCKNE